MAVGAARLNPLGRAAPVRQIDHDVLWPRDEDHRLRVYARTGHRLEVLAACPKEGLGTTLVGLHENEQTRGRRLVDRGAIGIYDTLTSVWLVMPWHRKEN